MAQSSSRPSGLSGLTLPNLPALPGIPTSAYAGSPALTGLAGLGPSLADMAAVGQAMRPQFNIPAPPSRPSIAINEQQGKLFVQGYTFDIDDAATALQTQALLQQPGTGLPTEPGWIPIGVNDYSNYLQTIIDPTRGQLFKKGFSTGVQQLKQLSGSALQLLGAEQLGGGIAERAEREIEKLEPFRRDFTDVKFGSQDRGLIDWFVATLGTQGPMLLESLAFGVAGAAAGTAAAGPGLGTAGGALTGIVGRKEFKKNVIKAAEKYRAGEASPKDLQLLKNASAITGAVAANLASSQFIGMGDIYGEMREQGVSPEDFGARMTAVLGSFPYALAETIPEFFVAGRVFGAGGRAPLPEGSTLGRRALEYGAIRPAQGAAIFGGAEAVTEGIQEGLVMGLSGQDLTSPEAVNRFINAMAAGAAVGGTLGGLANLRSNVPEPVDILTPPPPPPPPPPPQLALPPPYPDGPDGPPYLGRQGVLDFGFNDAEKIELNRQNLLSGRGAIDLFELAEDAPKVSAQGTFQFPTPESEIPSGIRFTDEEPPSPTSLGAVAPELRRWQLQRQFDEASAQEEQTQVDADFLQGPGGLQRAVRRRFAEIADRAIEDANRVDIPPTRERTPQPQAVSPQMELFSRDEAPTQRAPRDLRRAVTEDTFDPSGYPLGTDEQQMREIFAGITEIVGRQDGYDNEIAAKGQVTRLKRLNTDPDVDFYYEYVPGSRKYFVFKYPTSQPPAGVTTPPAAPPAAPVAPTEPPTLPTIEPTEPTGPIEPTEPTGPIEPTEPPTLPTIEPTEPTAPTEPTKPTRPTDEELDAQDAAAVAEDEARTAEIAEARAIGIANAESAFENLKGYYKGNLEDAIGSTRENVRTTLEEQNLSQWEAEAFEAFDARVQELLAEQPAPTKGEQLKRGKKRAVQESSTEEVSTRESARAGAEMGEGVPSTPKPARKGEALKKPKEKVKPVPETKTVQEPVTPEKAWDDTGLAKDFPFNELPEYAQKQWAELVAKNEHTKQEARRISVMRTPEDFWNDESPYPSVVPFGSLPNAVKAQWTKLVESNKATVDAASEIFDLVVLNPEQEVGIAILDYKDIESSSTERDAALQTIADYAFNFPEDTNTKAATDRARDFFNRNEIFSDTDAEVVTARIIEATNQRSSIEAVYTRGENKGKKKPWFEWVESKGALNRITTKITGLSKEAAKNLVENKVLDIGQFPKETQTFIKNNLPGAKELSTQLDTRDTNSNVGVQLARRINEINSTDVSRNNKNIKNITQELTDLYAEIIAKDIDPSDINVTAETTVQEYFENGKPKINIINKKLRIGTRKFTKQEISTYEADTAIDPDVAKTTERGPSDFIVRYSYDLPSSKPFRDDGTPITAPVPVGKIKLLINSFLGNLKIKPKVSVYKNQADFKAKNPQLYKQAADARPQGDFDTVSAVGYSFGDGRVVIFSERVATEKQLRFVLAHETLGHFGFRGLLSERQLNGALRTIYNTHPKIKAAADVVAEAHGIGKLEAVEEYLADYAGVIDTEVLARFWFKVKNALNKLGLTFEDDLVRYLVGQSRRYVRNGKTNGQFVDFAAMMDRAAAIESMRDPDGAGRFALSAPYYDQTNHVAADSYIGRRSKSIFELRDFLNKAKGKGINLLDYGERIVSELKTMNYAARDNMGYRRLYEILRDTVRNATELRTKYNVMMRTTLRPAVVMFGKAWSKGATLDQIRKTNAMLVATSRLNHAKLTDSQLRQLGSLISVVDGKAVINETVYNALRDRGTLKLENFKQGFKYQVSVTRPMTPEKKQEIIDERDAKLVGVTDLKEQKAIRREYQKLIDAPSAAYTVEKEFDAMPDITEQSLEWVMYQEVRSTMDQSAVDLLLANYAAAKGSYNRIYTVANTVLDKKISDDDKTYLDTIADKYLELRAAGLSIAPTGEVKVTKDAEKTAKEFIKAWNTALLARDTDKYQELLGPYFQGAEYTDVIKGLTELKTGAVISTDDKIRYNIQQAISNLAITETTKVDAELFAKRTITGGYVPFGREGSWQVRVQVVDSDTGTVLKPSEDYRKQMFFAQVDSRFEAEQLAENTNDIFGDNSKDGLYDIDVWDKDEGRYRVKKVKLVAIAETSRETVSSTSEVNLNEVLNTIVKFGVNITPDERARLVVGLTRQNARARNRLQRMDTPGADPDTIKFVSQHLEALASTIARKNNRHRIDDLFDDNNRESQQLWRGNKAEYDRREKAWEDAKNDPDMPEVLRNLRKQEFVDYHHTFVTKESEKLGPRYIDRGRRLVAFLESQTSVEFTDFASNEVGSQLRMWTTFAQLGGSFATGLLNVIALNTNVLPALAGQNEKNNFGGGFGWAKAATFLTQATNDVKSPKQSDAKYWDDLLSDSEKLKASGFTEAEALFMRKEVGAGSMQAALFNALLGSARGKLDTGFKQTAVKTWMSLFSYTEQASRRAAGLATFRLAYERSTQEGHAMGLRGEALQQYAFDKAERVAVDMIENTLGEYAMFNRPAFFRGDVRQFMFIYKMFPVNSVLMLSQMDKKTQLMALGILSLYSGLKGMPFLEDIMDLIDTIAQSLGWGPGRVWKGTAEKTALEALEAMFPGATPVMWRGIVNHIFPANVSDRTSLSNIVPGTSIGLAGANKGREIVEVLGPIASFVEQTVTTAANIAKYGAETIGLKEDTGSLTSIARNSPITMLRAMGDMAAYQSAGAIVNQKGYVVTEDLHFGTYLSRLLGFYPAAAVRENDVVRIATRLGNYHRDVASQYRGMYVAAMLAGRPDKAQEVVDMVNTWNEGARGTGLEIRRFVRSANMALREARRPASERYLKAASRSMRGETERLQYLLGLDEDY